MCYKLSNSQARLSSVQAGPLKIRNDIDIVGNLAAMLQLAMPQMQKTNSRETTFAISLVAGAGLNFGRTHYK